tara:strand:+ start:450 stop:851 length:402 start_codon:yes stop_codon:yes gene_type:complete
MKITGLDGREYPFPPSGKMPADNDTVVRSSLHLQAREILRRLYPTDRLLEEVSLPGTGGLVADFYLPNKKTVVECHGEQHYNFVRHFHGSKLNFLRSKRNDARKEEWCVLNNISLIELPYNEDKNEWEARLKG